MHSRKKLKMTQSRVNSSPAIKRERCFPLKYKKLGSLSQAILLTAFSVNTKTVNDIATVTARRSFVNERSITVLSTLMEFLPRKRVTEMYRPHTKIQLQQIRPTGIQETQTATRPLSMYPCFHINRLIFQSLS